MSLLLRRLLAFVVALSLVACASAPPGANLSGTGTVNSIAELREASQGGSLAGWVGGAVVGGMIGSLFGGGTGRTIATGVGATVGGVAGGQAGGQMGAVTAWDVSIRFEDGIDRVVRTYQQPNVRPGSKVRVDNGVVTPM